MKMDQSKYNEFLKYILKSQIKHAVTLISENMWSKPMHQSNKKEQGKCDVC
jgi:hypothetical protein